MRTVLPECPGRQAVFLPLPDNYKYIPIYIKRELIFLSANKELKPQDLENFFRKITALPGSST